MTTRGIPGKGRISGLGNLTIPAQTQRFSSARPGQRGPQQNPSPSATGSTPNALGEPISIREAAEVIGCSVWTIRQRYIPQGLPHLRSGPLGKLIFYRDQIVRWILQQQSKQGSKQGRR